MVFPGSVKIDKAVLYVEHEFIAQGFALPLETDNNGPTLPESVQL
jgi:hypothetical protein